MSEYHMYSTNSFNVKISDLIFLKTGDFPWTTSDEINQNFGSKPKILIKVLLMSFRQTHNFYILSETRMLRNHYFSVFLSDQNLLSSPNLVVDSWRRLTIVF